MSNGAMNLASPGGSSCRGDDSESDVSTGLRLGVTAAGRTRSPARRRASGWAPVSLSAGSGAGRGASEFSGPGPPLWQAGSSGLARAGQPAAFCRGPGLLAL